jgi:hypothetical protein
MQAEDGGWGGQTMAAEAGLSGLRSGAQKKLRWACPIPGPEAAPTSEGLSKAGSLVE